jgi:hypothetical protein
MAPRREIILVCVRVHCNALGYTEPIDLQLISVAQVPLSSSHPSHQLLN